ncbi:hypothetical protein HWV07_00810 [Natronomonas salina]|uniref:DUF7511 domain-containing protein n=1 Tax=Natronomonas salina TaxID=1710540 RepID=UPI0015B682A1|nr:hypothetical protein [Natronomonas salina]QLD87488.1 hypothetical protein HWV07_00810 [Natronomonas salina]
MTSIPKRTDARFQFEDAGEIPKRLESTLVQYDRRPDRRTVYPRGLSGVPRMSTWLTANDDAFVDLAAVR